MDNGLHPAQWTPKPTTSGMWKAFLTDGSRMLDAVPLLAILAQELRRQCLFQSFQSVKVMLSSAQCWGLRMEELCSWDNILPGRNSFQQKCFTMRKAQLLQQRRALFAAWVDTTWEYCTLKKA